MLPADVPLRRLLAVVVSVGSLLLLAGLASNTEQLWFASPEPEPAPRTVESSGAQITTERSESSGTQASPLPDWVPAVFLVAIIGIIVYLVVQHGPRFSFRGLNKRRLKRAQRQEPPTEDQQDDEIIRVTTDLIDELSIEGDPRIAIQRAYAAVETGFGSRELARKPAETPLRYLQRVFGRNLDQSGPLQQLTTLFETARFSQRPITEDMRDQAIGAVSDIREHYRSRRRGRVR